MQHIYHCIGGSYCHICSYSAVVGFSLPSRKVKVLGEELGYNKVSLLLLVPPVI